MYAFGVREICNVVLRAKTHQYLGKKEFFKNEPVLYFDTLRTSSMEGASTTVYAQGGRGYARLVAWDGERTITWNMEDALISPESFSVLAGAGLIDAGTTVERDEDGNIISTPLYVHTTSQIEVEDENTIVLPEEACWSKYDESDDLYHDGADIFIMTLDDEGRINAEPCIPASVADDHKTITCYSHEGTLKKGSVVKVDYYIKKTSNALRIDIAPDKFGGNYYLEADTLFREKESGVDMPAVFTIPNCKVQSNFTFTMGASGDPSTFSFVLDAFPAYTKFNKTEKVLASIDVVTDDVDSAESEREVCKASSTTEETTNP